jgi:FHS family L-fucose permease-like MFS transporter
MNDSNKKARLITPGYGFTFALVVLLFFLWAFPNIFNDVLIKQFRKSLELMEWQTGFLPLALKTGYFCLAIPAGLFMQKWGYKNGILVGLAFFSLGCFIFYPAAMSREFFVFLGGIFVMASGCAFLEIGANSFVVSLGDKSTSERRLNLAQSFNPIGGIVASTLGTLFIFSGNEPTTDEVATMKTVVLPSGINAYEAFLRDENQRIIPVYIALGIAVLIIGLIIWRAKFPEVSSPAKEGEKANEQKGSFKELLKFPHWWGAIISQFFYLGAQLGTWSFLITYVQDNSPLKEKQAGALLVVNMIIFMAGRFFSTWLMKYVKPSRLMGIYALINIVLVSIAILGSHWGEAHLGIGLFEVTVSIPFIFDGTPLPVGIYALITTTLFMSLMYPTNFASGMKGLGPNAKLGASILVMSLIGGAVLSLVMGQIWGSDIARLDNTPGSLKAIAPALIVPVISYIVICRYAFIGSKPRGPLYEY